MTTIRDLIDGPDNQPSVREHASAELVEALRALERIERADALRPGHIDYVSKGGMCAIARRVLIDYGWMANPE